MTTKADFTADEWKKILSGPVVAGLAVTVADPSGIWGLLQEGMASGRALIEAKSDPGANALVKELVDELTTSDGRANAREGVKSELTAKTPAEIKQQALSSLAEIGAIVDAKAPQDAAGFKNWLRHVAEQVAEASSEGGFLGFGGVKVSDAEKATLAEIATALKLA
ncbi:hypothetical protein [uncultured Rhodoblastus sp.]|uniref:hypothetical protein n=1 Tax=uncultured Rhodoblastus sp. TaxID=543037 RepID=UPI0025DF59EF|nr:hypothetical protein [uncultured Rhodoblastus sp.]